MRALARTTLLAVTLAGLLAAPARANIVAMVETQVGSGSSANLDLIAIDTATGTHLDLPSGINTASQEFHPSVTSDGRFAVFQRNTAGASPRIIMVNLATGVQADLFSGLESTVTKPATPAISPDGSRVVVGREVKTSGSAGIESRVTSVDVSNFPGGPFPKDDVLGGVDGVRDGTTRNPSVLNDDHLAWKTIRNSPAPQELSLSFMPGDVTFKDINHNPVDHPALQPGNSSFSVFQLGPSPSALFVRGGGNTTALPGIVNSGRDESRPAFDASGRYLAFIRPTSGGDETIRVWDTTTQEIVNPATPTGIATTSSFANLSRSEGAVALFIPDPLISRFTCCRERVRFRFSGPTSAGLLIQRIRGRKRLLGHTVPKLKRAGKFPLGRFRKGSRRKHWGLTVRRGRKLRKLRSGCYLVTLRALTRRGRVRELSKPYTLRVRRGKRALARRGVKLSLCRRR